MPNKNLTQTEVPRPIQFQGCTPLHPALYTALVYVYINIYIYINNIGFIEGFFKIKPKSFMHHSCPNLIN